MGTFVLYLFCSIVMHYLISLGIIYAVALASTISSYESKEISSTEVQNPVTIRMNTFRRNDLLQKSVSHYVTCTCVKEIQIVWSDQKNKPSTNLFGEAVGNDKIKYEIHDKDSLNNRFLPELSIPTQVVLSIDDDLIIPCDDLEFALGVWSTSKRALVGFSPRMHVRDMWTGALRYLRWQHTFWNGAYSIVLTKAAFFHQDYLLDFRKTIPESLLQYVDKHRNCEDIFMAYVIALKSGAPPVWVRGRVQEIGQSGISSGSDHFETRSACLSVLENEMPTKNVWITGYQKAIKVGFLSEWDFGLFDFFRLLYDTK